MPFARGVHAWIEVDGAPLPEYKTQDDSNRSRTTCYIASEQDKKFCIRFQNVEPTVTALRGNIFLDGVHAGAALLLSTDSHAAKVTGQTRWEGLECPFQFSQLRTTDDESRACRDENRLRELGTIRVQIEWVSVLRQEAWRPLGAPPMPANEPVFERSKKASAHCASFGHLQTSRPKHWYSTSRIPFIEPTEFVFHYAPQEWLQAKDIVPSATASKRKHGTLTASDGSDGSAFESLDEEEAAEYHRLRAKLAARHKRQRKAVKREHCEAELGPSTSSTDIIDLTGDD